MKDVVTYVTHNNLALLEVMTDLTGAVGSVASEKTKRLRVFQALAIVIAVINFFFILFFSLQRIRKIDDELVIAKTEIDVMLHTISEGIFLLDQHLTISDEYSKEMEVIFNKKNLKGVSLLNLLREVCVNYNEKGIANFLLALFDSTKKLSVLLNVNPLQELVINISGQEKYIRFSYARVESDLGVDKVLVRVCDITEDVVHSRLVSEERNQQFKHLRLMSALMNSNADLLPAFFQRAFSVITSVKELLGEYQSDTPLNYQASLVALEDLHKEANLLAFDKLSKLIERLSSCIANLDENDAFSEISHSEALSAVHALKEYAETMCDFSANLLADSGSSSSIIDARSSKYFLPRS